MRKFRARRHVGIDGAAPARAARILGDGGSLAEQRRQIVISQRPDDDIDGRCAAADLGAFGLGDAAGGDDDRARPVGARFAQAPDVGIQLFRRLLADMASVEDDDIGGVAAVGGDMALGGQHVAHALAVIDVHLAAEGFDVITGHEGQRLRLDSIQHSGSRRRGHPRSIARYASAMTLWQCCANAFRSANSPARTGG